MQQVRLGGTVVVADPNPPQHREARGTPNRAVRRVSLLEARALVGYRIFQPIVLGSMGFALDHIGLTGIGTIFSKYRTASGRWLVLQQSSAPARGTATVRRVAFPSVREGVVGDHAAALYTQPTPIGSLTIAHCLWEQDGFLFELQAPQFDPEYLARIGASLA